MKVFFVGVHNKPGLAPLDSSTLTGKTVDAVISKAKDGLICIKTNLFDQDHLPHHIDWKFAVNRWSKRVGYKRDEDKVVLLGEFVRNRFFQDGYLLDMIAIFNHPAMVMSKRARQEYIDNMARYINV